MNMKTIATLTSFVLLVGVLVTYGVLSERPVSETTRESEFRGFPLNESRMIEFDVQPADLPGGWREANDPVKNGTITRRDLLDQYRDWLLVTVLQSLDLPMDELSNAMFDIPTVRNDHIRRVAAVQTGGGRSALFGDGEVVALVPAGEGPEKIDRLADIADEQRKNLGSIPVRFHVFEYDIDSGEQFATLTRRAPTDGERLFTADYGYHSQPVIGVDGFREFMGRIDDLTYAAERDHVLVLGGRRLQRDYRGIRPEDVATIWKSEQSAEGRNTGTGFSLDPQMDFTAAEEFIAENRIQLVLLFGYDAVIRAGAAVRERDEATFTEALREGCATQGRDDCAGLVRAVVWENLFQAARYDGRLQGTEVGMVLFYTDLLMKLWCLDVADAVPAAIDGFPNETHVIVPASYEAEFVDLSQTRLWLGSLESGYQISNDGAEIVFGRSSTRVFAVPHDYTSNQDHQTELEPNYVDRIFINWWNDRFEEVARYEPEYERLNEIMKWSQIMGWLNREHNFDSLAFLEEVPDEDPVRFDLWVDGHPELSFQNWSAIRFHEPGYGGVQTESLPILSSPSGRTIVWTGGVSLARRSEIARRSAVSREVAPALRRGSLDFGSTGPLSDSITTLNRTQYSFRTISGNRTRILAEADSSVRLRGLYGEVRNASFETLLERGTGQFSMRSRIGNTGIGELRVGRTGQGFKVGWQGRDLSQAEAFARKMSASEDPAALLSSDPAVEAVFQTIDAGYYVKLRGSNQWTTLTSGDVHATTLKDGSFARISDAADSGRVIDVGFSERFDPAAFMQGQGYVRIQPASGPRNAGFVRLGARGPPQGARLVPTEIGGNRVPTYLDTAGTCWVRYADLPDALKSNPEALVTLGSGSRPSVEAAGLLEALGEHRYAEVAREIATEPGIYRSRMEHHLRQELARNDQLLSAERFDLAIQQINDLIRVYGRSPDLLARKGLAEISRGRPHRALFTFEESANLAMRNFEAFLAEVNARIRSQSSTAAMRENLENYARLVDWHGNQQSLSAAGELRPVANGTRLTLEFETQRLPGGRPATVEEIASGVESPVYITDRAGIDSLDWSPSVEQSLHQLVSANRIEVHQVEMVSLSHFRPSSVVASESGSRLRLMANTGRVSSAGYRSYRSSSCQEEEDGCSSERRVYLITDTSR